MITKKGISFYHINFSWITIAGIIVIALILSILGFKIFKADSKKENDELKTSEVANFFLDLKDEESKENNKQNTQSLSQSSGTASSDNVSFTDDEETNSNATSEKYYLLSLGDSITNANSPASSMPGDNKSYSYATGSASYSFYSYIKSDESVTPINLAVSGAKTEDCLTNQVPKIKSYKAKYITILIGGNDLLSYFTENPVLPANFQTNLDQIVAEATDSGARVYIGNIPNYANMWQADHDSCDPFKTLNPTLVSAGISYFNNIISSVAGKYGVTKIDLYSSSLGSGDVSDADCIHPNLEGQEKIAQAFIEKF